MSRAAGLSASRQLGGAAARSRRHWPDASRRTGAPRRPPRRMNRPLLRLALAGLRAHAVRVVLTGFAVVVAVGFLAGTLVYGDTARAAFYTDLARSARNVDVLVEPEHGLLTPATLQRVRAVEGVAAADGRVVAWLGVLDRNGKLVTSREHIGYALSVPTESALAPYDVAAGRLPTAAGEVALDRATVAGAGFVPGGPVTVLDRAGAPHRMRLVGTLDLGVNRLFGGSTVAALTSADLGTLTATVDYAQVVVRATDGTDPTRLRSRIAEAVGPGASTLSGAALRDRLARQAAKYVDGFLAVLLGFGLVSLTVSAFVIYNTFAMLGAQRVRELSLLRCVGASRRQVGVAVLLEAGVLGLLASLGGLLASLLVGYGLIRGRELVASDIPLHAPVVRWPTVAVALGFGVLVTVLAALVPAVEASRVPPLAALRARDAVEAGPGPGRPRRARIAVAAGLVGTGVLAVLVGLPLAFPGLPLVLGGGMVAFLGAVVAAPLLVPRAVRLVGWLPARIFGPVVRLAVANARRNPRRAAATSTALTIGVALMAMFSVLLATAREQAGRELTENFPVDFVLDRVRTDGSPTAVRGPLPPGVAQLLRPDPAFGTVAEIRLAEVRLAEVRLAGSPLDARIRVWAVPPEQLHGVIRPEVTAGSLAGLAPGTVAVSRQLAADRGVGVGDRIALGLGPPGPLTVVAVYDDTPVDGAALVSWSSFVAAYGPGEPDRLLVDLAPGVSTAAGRQALDAALADQPAVRVRGLADQADALSRTLDELLGIFAALLGMSVLVAVLGIGNTLALSVFERRRESATIRALGVSRRQLAAMLLTEAALAGAVGALGGIALGLGLGWTAAMGLISSYGHGLPAVPVGQLALCAALAAGAAVLASLLPARRAARAPIVSTLADEG
ncbi:ABC transporter permease [Plantactinospora endophytica]|uniref:ABC transporter substrate-binding protein n=1 Tax=Plantactinospora endophytica TaxID=673535 RepID=A0ABQ4E6D9_9ACTN|nr:ABC transporter permease [Plantactinospora endophytica]GIG90285.1 ABC transporter substrate-binding protein [Plantactinospora endophytica]